MIRVFLCVVMISLCFPTLWGQNNHTYPSLPSEVLSNYTPEYPELYRIDTMVTKADAFLGSHDEVMRKQAALDFDSHEKGRWTNVPPRGPQGGVRLGDLNEVQLKLVCDFFAAVMSPQGYYKAINIPLADDRLLKNGQRRPGFGAEDYWLAFFGEPSNSEPWAIQFDGHHIAINLAFHGDQMCMSPTFIGTQPRSFNLGENQIEPMVKMDQLALSLVRSLSDEQRSQAVLGNRRANLVAGAGRDGRIPKAVGVSCSSFDDGQREKLTALIQLYVGNMPEPFAGQRIKQLQGETAAMTFGWWGPVQDNGDYSYRLQGPSLIIEYAGQDLGGDPHEHLHSIYRDPTNEYGDRFSEKSNE